MTKMDMIWIAVATMLKPATESSKTVTRGQIETQVSKLFDAPLTPVMIEKHLVSWEDRQADKDNPKRGGSRNRYLFRTSNGRTPSREGQFRLYKVSDGHYDGWDKNGRTCPKPEKVAEDYQHLISWYKNQYTHAE